MPDFWKDYPLIRAQIENYRRDGHVFLPGVASTTELAQYRPVIRNVLEVVLQEKDTQGRIDDYSNLFLQVANVWRKSEVVKRFVIARRFAKIAADLMGVGGVRLYHDQLLFKEPGGRPTPWHRDQYYWPLETEHTITMWMPLVDVSKEMGPMIFASGSQRGEVKSFPISEEADKIYQQQIAEEGLSTVSYELQAGDATFHSGRTLHSAHPNTSKTVREVITIIYYADGTHLMQPDNEHRKVDMEAFHPGQMPGEIAASPLNPLLYPA